jgi:ubiquinone/menaquinone biosynthesis C-methylase UbiE
MIWLLLLAIPAIPLILWALRPMKIPREPGREGPQVGEAVAAYDRTSRWPIFIAERAIILHEIALDRPLGVLLDIGCGPGFLAAAVSRGFLNSSIIGLDISREMADIAGRRWPAASYPNLTFLTADAQQLPIADRSIDYVFSSLSLHHWSEPEKVFGEICRVLKPAGRFLIFDLRRDGPNYFYSALKIGQIMAAPRAIKETNGAVGSFWASYTAPEIKKMLFSYPLQHRQVDKRFPWLLIRGEVEDRGTRASQPQ